MGEPAQPDSTLLYLVVPASESVTGTIVMADHAQFRSLNLVGPKTLCGLA